VLGVKGLLDGPAAARFPDGIGEADPIDTDPAPGGVRTGAGIDDRDFEWALHLHLPASFEQVPEAYSIEA